MELFNTTFTEQLKDDNFKLKEGEALIYKDEDLIEYEHDYLDSLKPDVKNMNHAVERDDYPDNTYNTLLSVELLLPNESVDGIIQGIVIKRAKTNLGQSMWL